MRELSACQPRNIRDKSVLVTSAMIGTRCGIEEGDSTYQKRQQYQFCTMQTLLCTEAVQRTFTAGRVWLCYSLTPREMQTCIGPELMLVELYPKPMCFADPGRFPRTKRETPSGRQNINYRESMADSQFTQHAVYMIVDRLPCKPQSGRDLLITKAARDSAN